MHPEKVNTIEMLSQYVAFIRTVMGTENGNIYPVLGAHGTEFFIELASGTLLKREILMTILVTFGNIELDFEGSQKAFTSKTEIYLQLPDSAHLIALLGLLEKAFNGKTTILHPLDSQGNYYPGWSQAAISVSGKPF